MLIAGLITTLAHGYSLGQTHRLDSTAALVQANLGSFLGALTAAASLLAMVVAVAALVSTATTFIVVSVGLPESYRVVDFNFRFRLAVAGAVFVPNLSAR
ncbi:Uncharacterised protein [Mobiluncus curtisii]|uniref:Uncharacterized protein n=2 Tax=Mobiluncus curtisii TaxID=2051 RepID=A0A2X3BKZ4_9ACTO|nr:Uncharacterised protein [Mobiluncus curtisii]